MVPTLPLIRSTAKLWERPANEWPSAARIVSPATIPAFAAGVPGYASPTSSPPPVNAWIPTPIPPSICGLVVVSWKFW